MLLYGNDSGIYYNEVFEGGMTRFGKSLVYIALLGIGLVGIFLFFKPLSKDQDFITVVDEHLTPSVPTVADTPITEKCGAQLVSPKPNEIVHESILVELVVAHPAGASCNWVVFEGQGGTVELIDEDGLVIATALLETIEEWMTTEPVLFTGTLSVKEINSAKLKIKITEDDPSGIGIVDTITIPVIFEATI